MQKYLDINKNSGVTAYELGKDFIRVEFNDKTTYLYTEESTGKEAIKQMKNLAQRGYGLATYINQHVRSQFAKKEQ